MKKSIILVLLASIAAIGWISVPRAEKAGQIRQDALNRIRIYAYRDWQGTGVSVYEGDLVSIRAQGTWLYTPDEYHGPEGHRRYSAPQFYPVPGIPGGALIGRIGTDGQPSYVGRGTRWRATENGQIYLRIDDDILSDNEGFVEIQITVVPADEDSQ
ncbi:MAG: hypothetical protein JW918_08725 [Anaerolineae bacterium]|nr:hypothetical protein [Anaerolineae bacterium]